MRIRIARATATAAAGCACALLLTACAGSPASGPGKNGDAPPTALSGLAGAERRPVPHGSGSHTPDDFNGDGRRDLVLDNLVKRAADSHGDDAGIGIVYGSASRGLDPSVRQLLSAHANAARIGGTLPSAFDAEASCDLDQDGFTDLIVATDPPYNGIGRPPVPLQILFGSPAGLTGKAVALRIPDRARFGNEWPDHPVCGDFDGDHKPDLAVTASSGRLSFLRGPFTRDGRPHAAGGTIPGAGPALSAPEPRADTNGDGYDDLVYAARPHEPGTSAKGALLLGSPDGPGRPGGPYRFRAPAGELPAAPLHRKAAPTTGSTDPSGSPAQASAETTLLIRYADFDGDKKPDTVVRTHRGETADLIALYPAAAPDRPLITFTSALFNAG
ncbi:VCBS repeat-containing protein [Streptomyces laculatispora]|uniref:VCBS repeat-containing protein n=1 Tax=Streptomyces laculatispora TaxID=887464 RepID=A0ABY9I5X8_9ACTN|nr:VCBS repeat-containing protein [Streptomyces laculatispora]WLQ42205.1 VCBS repeat-containing protein [Streptomyces laculatispora]